MKGLHLLVWLTQLGLSVALPLAGFPLLALWLQSRFGWGKWALWLGLILGIVSAVEGFRTSLQTMHRMSREKKKSSPPPISFHEHE